jgi:hypothetical protein
MNVLHFPIIRKNLLWSFLDNYNKDYTDTPIIFVVINLNVTQKITSL